SYMVVSFEIWELVRLRVTLDQLRSSGTRLVALTGPRLASHSRISGSHQKFRLRPSLRGRGKATSGSRIQRQIVISETGTTARSSLRPMYRCTVSGKRSRSSRAAAPMPLDGNGSLPDQGPLKCDISYLQQ